MYVCTYYIYVYAYSQCLLGLFCYAASRWRCIHLCIHTCMHAYIRTHVHTCIHTHKHTHTHTYTRTYTCQQVEMQRRFLQANPVVALGLQQQGSSHGGPSPLQGMPHMQGGGGPGGGRGTGGPAGDGADIGSAGIAGFSPFSFAPS